MCRKFGSSQEGDESDSSVEPDVIDYRNEAMPHPILLSFSGVEYETTRELDCSSTCPSRRVIRSCSPKARAMSSLFHLEENPLSPSAP